MLAVWFGLATGLAEFLVSLVTPWSQRRVTGGTAERLWKTPLTDIILLAAIGLVLCVFARVFPRIITRRIAVFSLTAAGLFFVLYNFQALQTLAIGILAAGFGVQAARLDARRPAFLTSIINRSCGSAFWPQLLQAPRQPAEVNGGEPLHRREVLAGCAATVVGLAGGVKGWDWAREQLARAALPPAPTGRPNILLIVLDTVRAKSLGLCGYKRPTTPNLERWARQGISFNHAIAPAPFTLPTHMTLFTGRWLSETSGLGFTTPFTDPFPTLAEVLGRAGYESAGFVANIAFLRPDFGLARGFVHYECFTDSPGQVVQASAIGQKLVGDERIRRLIGYHQTPGRKQAPDVSRSFLNWLGRRDTGRPYFAFLNYLDAHQPYIPLPAARGMFGGRRDQHPSVYVNRRYGPEEASRLADLYDECVVGLDGEIGRLLDTLEARGELDNTLVVITSDHGEHLGEHGFMEHSFDLYVELVHVPLIIVHRGAVPGGVKFERPVTLRDVPATILDFAGVDRCGIPGSSLARCWNAPAAAGDGFILCEAPQAPDWIPAFYPARRGAMQSLIRGEYQYIRNGDETEELYDIQADPCQQVDLAKSAADGQRLCDFRAYLMDVVRDGRGGRA